MSQTFAARLTRQPIAFDPAPEAEIRSDFSDLPPEVTSLLAATAGCSPYLRGLMTRESDWLRAALAMRPEAALQAELDRLDPLPLADLPAALRQSKRRLALLAALCDLGGIWPLAEVTGALTALADRAVDLPLQRLIADEVRRGKLTDLGPAHGMVVFAMGKMGAGELNYSSDIDLICLFDETLYPGTELDARAAFIRVTRRLTAILSDVTAEGYVFRTDLRLRPDSGVTPVCLTMGFAMAYYEAEGRTWERAAWIKARPCGGDLAAGTRFLKALTPFVWRRHLDYAAIEDAHAMRLRIRGHRGLGGAVKVEGHDIKLGQGGIREIEFFTQTRQLIAGGRDADLRGRTTVGGLASLAEKGWIPKDVADTLAADYRAHRELEHRLQMVNDAQTHEMPVTPEAVARIAAFLGQPDPDFRADLLARIERVETLTQGFFAPSAADASLPELTPQMRAIVSGWQSYPALRSDRARAIFRRLAPSLLTRLTEAQNPEEALVALDGFLSGLPAGVQIFSLFEANPPLVDLIIDIASTAPALARYLSRNAGVLDGVIGGSFFAPWPGAAELTRALTARLEAQPDYEKTLDAARVFLKDWHFRVGVHHLRGLIDAFEAAKSYADLAQSVLAALWPVVGEEFARKHGPAPGRGAVLLGMGSLGAARLNAGSDLDLLMIYDAPGIETSDGRRPLPTRSYFSRLTQALVTALSVPTAEGKLYEVDMRLRPSGRQGPVAVSLASFESYQRTEAWTWEHLALTRARVLAGDPGLGAEVEAIRRSVLAEKGQGGTVLADVADMRARLAAAKPGLAPWEAKLGPGKLMDIELLAQTLALQAASPARGVEAQIAAGRKAGRISAAQAGTLLKAYRLCWHLQAGSRLLSDRDLDPAKLGMGARAFLLRECEEASPEALSAHLAEAAAGADAEIAATLTGP
jgi:glutamate-ammonia-ligase adenylyltransferase